MWELITHSSNIPFSVSITLMLLIGILELISAGVASGILDSLIPDFDADIEVDSDIQIPALSTLLGWLKGGSIPVLIYLIIFLLVFSLSGFIMQSFIYKAIGHFLPSWIAIWPALFITVFVARGICSVAAKIVIKDETTAVDPSSFIGKVAIIVNGTAKKGLPAEAKLKDKYNNRHYIRVEPDSEDEVYSKGTRVLVVERVKGSLFKVINTFNQNLID